jgi:hypothetical protein
MTRYQKDLRQEGFSSDRSDQKPYDDYNVLEPSPDIDLNYMEDDDDELSDYTLMDNAVDLDYEE